MGVHWLLALLLAASPVPSSVPSGPIPRAERTAVLVGAGDIAVCGPGTEATAKILDRTPGTVFTLGDNVYPDGSAANFRRCYDPTWGRAKARTRPAVGNHDYRTEHAKPYYDYFGSAAGDRTKGYYSYDLGGWHIVVLNSVCAEVSCSVSSAQNRWLRADLRRSTARCTAALWHHPLYTSGKDHGPTADVRPLYQTLYDNGADVNLTGHNHNYERFSPMDPWGHVDAKRGLVPFVVGTGGASHYGFRSPAPGSLVRDAQTFGVLKLTLHPDGAEYAFLPIAGRKFTDSGRITCH